MKFPQKIGNTWWSFAHWFENLEHGASPGKNWGCWRKPFQTKTSAILKKPLRRLTRFTNKFLCLCSCSGVDGSAVDALDCPRVRFRSLAEATLFAFSYIFYNYFIFFLVLPETFIPNLSWHPCSIHPAVCRLSSTLSVLASGLLIRITKECRWTSPIMLLIMTNQFKYINFSPLLSGEIRVN